MDNLSSKSNLRVWLADLTHTGVNGQSLGVDTFPLAIGCIATYAESKIIFNNPIRLFRYPDKFAQALVQEGAADVVGFSNFVWNCQLSLAMARRIKELNPQAIVVMGGPNYPLERTKQEEFLRNHPEVDFYILNEGEASFVNLLNVLAACKMDVEKVKQGPELSCVQSLDKQGRFRPASGLIERLDNLDQIPSPYVMGKFDEFFDGKLWPLIQTKRGCPFSCTYCTEGNDYYNKVVKFSLDYLKEQIEYIGKKMSHVRSLGGRSDIYIGDSNFGMYEEDMEIARALARSYELYGWPDHINTSTGKNQKQRILEVARIVEGRIVLSGSVQSLDPVVLENIKRKNISAEELMSLAKEARDVDANSYCEVILGLPGETKASHFQTLRTVVNAGFNKVIPYQLMILAGSQLATQETITKYGMRLRSRVLPRAFGKYNIAGEDIAVADIEDICVASNSMSYQDYIECRLMHLVITIFYNDIVFGTLLKAMRANELSVFRWLELIQVSLAKTELDKLFQEFRSHTETELWEDRKDLEGFIQEPGTIGRYASGEIGFNLLYTFKASALVHYSQAMSAVVRDALKCLRSESGRINPDLDSFFDSVIRWDLARFTGIVKNLDHEIVEEFSYDISRFSADEIPQRLSHYVCLKPIRWQFNLTETQKDYIRRNLKIFGDDAAGIGRVLSNSHTKQLLRQPVMALDELNIPQERF